MYNLIDHARPRELNPGAPVLWCKNSEDVGPHLLGYTDSHCRVSERDLTICETVATQIKGQE